MHKWEISTEYPIITSISVTTVGFTTAHNSTPVTFNRSVRVKSGDWAVIYMLHIMYATDILPLLLQFVH
jgi:hypothetical protein